MADREKVLAAMECIAGRANYSVVEAQCLECPYYDATFESGCDEWAMIIDALSLLKEQEPRVMTRKDIEGSDGAEFYSEHKGEEYLYMDHTEGPAYIMGNMERFSLKHLRWEDYGKTWRCWNARPSPDQRLEVPWE